MTQSLKVNFKGLYKSLFLFVKFIKILIQIYISLAGGDFKFNTYLELRRFRSWYLDLIDDCIS